MITIKELKEHCERQLNKSPKGSKTYEEHLLTLNIIETLKEKDKQIEKVLDLIFEYGQIDGGHHKAWVIDQTVRILTGDKYNEFVKKYEIDEETGEKEWTWKNGIAP